MSTTHSKSSLKKKYIKKGRRSSRRKMQSFLLSVWVFIRVYIDYFIDFIFGLYYNSKVEHVQAVTNPILLESAMSLARKIRNQIYTSEKVVSAYIDRIKEVNPLINAVVDNRFEAAIEEARQIDLDIISGVIQKEDFERKPFLGIPFTSKDSTQAKGLSNTLGLKCREGLKAKEDAEVIQLMKKAGGILLGVTNVPELNMWSETFCPVYGRTNNPYNSTRNVGGSSGGEASIISAAGSPLGVGSDIGGSTRIPCFMCGLFGHKPSANVTSTKGLGFRKGEEGPTMVSAGPIVRYAEDLMPFLKVLVGSNKDMLKLDEPVEMKNLNIFYMEEYRDPKVSSSRPEMKQILRKCVNHLGQLTISDPERLDAADTRYGGKLWRYWMTQEPYAQFRKHLTNNQGEVNPYLEIVKYPLGMSEYSGSSIFNLFNTILPKERESWAREVTKNLLENITNTLSDNGVLIFPSAPWPASYHYTAFLRPFNFNYFALWNAINLPVTQVPLGLGAEGLPLGVQVIAGPNQDHLCIAVAKELEKAFGGYVPPFEVNTD